MLSRRVCVVSERVGCVCGYGKETMKKEDISQRTQSQKPDPLPLKSSYVSLLHLEKTEQNLSIVAF